MADGYPVFAKGLKKGSRHQQSFIFPMSGLVNFLAKRGTVQQGSELFGKAFENWCFHELTAYNLYNERFAELFYWRLAGGTEVDFIINDMEVAVEAKATSKITARHLKGLRSLKVDHPDIQRRLIICCEDKRRVTDDNIEIVPAALFSEMLWHGDIF